MKVAEKRILCFNQFAQLPNFEEASNFVFSVTLNLTLAKKERALQVGFITDTIIQMDQINKLAVTNRFMPGKQALRAACPASKDG